MSLLPLYAGDTPANAPQFAIDVVAHRPPRNVLTNEGIVLLSDAGYDEDFLMDIIVHKQTRFDTSVEGLTLLANHGISERIVRFMVAHENKPAGPDVPGAPGVAPALTAVAPAHVVKQKVLVPGTNKAAQPAVINTVASAPVYQYSAPYTVAAPSAASYALYAAHPRSIPAVQPGPYNVAPAPAGQYVRVRRYLFWKRWYVVNAPAAQAQPYSPLVYSNSNAFPVW